MKILQIVPVFSDSAGGTTTVVKSISKYLAKKHEVVVFTTTLDFKSPFAKREFIDGYEVNYFKHSFQQLSILGLFRQINLSLGMMNAIKNNLKYFDIVHVNSWNQFPEIALHHYAKKFSAPYVLQVHGSLHRFARREKLKLAYNVFFGYMVLRDAAKAIAFNEVEAQEYRNMGKESSKITVIPNGIDLSKYSKLPKKLSFKKDNNIPENTHLILYLGRINETKGIDFLIKAYSYFVKTNKNHNSLLVIAGPDDGYLPEIKSMIVSLGIVHQVLLTGLLTEQEKIAAFVDASVCAYLSQFEPFGLVTLEAAACGIPIIVSKGTPIAQVVEESRFGYSVTYGEIGKLAEVFRNIINNVEDSEKIGQIGRKYVFENYDYSKVILGLERVYEESISSK